MARKRKAVKTIIVQASISLEPGVDDDLIQLYAALPARGRAAFIRAASRGQLTHTPPPVDIDDSDKAFLADFAY